MKKTVVLFAMILSVPMTQAKESSIYSLFEEPGKNGVLKQLAAISKAAEQGKKSLSEEKTTAACPSLEQPGPLTKRAIESNSTPVETRCQFAYDLHRFVASKGRDYDSFVLSNSSSNSAPGAKKARAGYLPYREQESFADNWWAEKNRSYRESSPSQKKIFLHKAIIDATSLYGMYGERVYGTAEYVAWEEAGVRAVLKKQ
ncbi:MAG: hypothetical protein WC028_27755 [Candidatus Obscuribacterales bacterium]